MLLMSFAGPRGPVEEGVWGPRHQGCAGRAVLLHQQMCIVIVGIEEQGSYLPIFVFFVPKD